MKRDCLYETFKDSSGHSSVRIVVILLVYVGYIHLYNVGSNDKFCIA